MKNGKLSCCARGGEWFDNCGDDGDTNFDHTWAEGAAACEGKLTSRWMLILPRMYESLGSDMRACMRFWMLILPRMYAFLDSNMRACIRFWMLILSRMYESLDVDTRACMRFWILICAHVCGFGC